MAPEIEEIKQEIEKVLLAFAEQGEASVIANLRPVLLTNLMRGRIAVFIEGDLRRVQEYILKVAQGQQNLSAFVHQIQVERSTETWEPLFLKMQDWAFNFFVRKGFYPDQTTRSAAVECATDAAIALLRAHFPYDVEFDPWAHMIVLHTCRKQMRQGMLAAKNQIGVVAIEEADNIADPAGKPLEGRDFSTVELSAALGMLPAPRRQVIELMYFDGLSSLEVAGALGKSVGAVYSLHFNALLDLRKIMSKTGSGLDE